MRSAKDVQGPQLTVWASRSESCRALGGMPAWKVRRKRSRLRQRLCHLRLQKFCNLLPSRSFDELLAALLCSQLLAAGFPLETKVFPTSRTQCVNNQRCFPLASVQCGRGMRGLQLTVKSEYGLSRPGIPVYQISKDRNHLRQFLYHNLRPPPLCDLPSSSLGKLLAGGCHLAASFPLKTIAVPASRKTRATRTWRVGDPALQLFAMPLSHLRERKGFNLQDGDQSRQAKEVAVCHLNVAHCPYPICKRRTWASTFRMHIQV